MTVKNWITSNNEKVVYISPDDRVYNLHDPAKKSILNMTGWGMPRAVIADTHGPFQHGTDPLTIRIPPRELSVTVRHNGCDRREYWSNRSGLINALRVNRTSLNNPSPGHLRWYMANGQIRQVDVFAIRGPDFDPNKSGWDEHSYQDEIRFMAHNPIIYDPSQVTDSFNDLGCTIIEELQFPITFGGVGILFGGSTCNAINTLTVNYEGNWQEYPFIEVYGPADNFSIDHVQTGLRLELENYSIAAGDKVTFDLRYGRKLVTLFSTDDSLLGYLSDDSDLGNFAIEPDPAVADGINDFSVSIDNGTGDTLVIFKYYNRYIGI